MLETEAVLVTVVTAELGDQDLLDILLVLQNKRDSEILLLIAECQTNNLEYISKR